MIYNDYELTMIIQLIRMHDRDAEMPGDFLINVQ